MKTVSYLQENKRIDLLPLKKQLKALLSNCNPLFESLKYELSFETQLLTVSAKFWQTKNFCSLKLRFSSRFSSPNSETFEIESDGAWGVI